MKYSTFSFILLVVFALSNIVFAQTLTLPDAGTLPDSPFYFLKTWKEQIQLFFTFDAEKKAEQYLRLAEVRLAEYRKMVEKGKQEIAEGILTKYQDQLKRATDKLDELKTKGKDIKNLSQKVEKSVFNHLQVIKENSDKVPEEAKTELLKALETLHKSLLKIPEFAQANEEIIMKAQDVNLISDAQAIGNDLKNYFSIKGRYPKNLKEFFSDKSYSGSIVIREEQIDEFIGRQNYIVSPQYDHFLLFVNLSFPKEKIGVGNAIDHEIFGVKCGDQRIFCVTDLAVTSTENRLSGWQTYRNERYGFEFKYPATLTFKNDGETVKGVVPKQWWAKFQNSSQKGSLELLITENRLVDVKAKSVPYGPGGEGSRATQEVMVGTKKGLLFDGSYEGVSATIIRVPLGVHSLEISFSSVGNDSFYSDRLIIDQILSTFKFISPLEKPINRRSFIILSPNGETYRTNETINVSWTPYDGNFDSYDIQIGNQGTGGMRRPTIGVAVVPKSETSISISNLSDIVNRLGGKSPEAVQNYYYVKVLATNVKGTIVAQAESNLFSILPEPTGQNGAGNWQTYRNERYGFEVKYPSTFHLMLDNEGLVYKLGSVSFRSDFTILTIFEIEKKPAGIPLIQYLKEKVGKTYYNDALGTSIANYWNFSEKTINGKSVVTADKFTFEACPASSYWFSKDETQYLQIDVIKCYKSGKFSGNLPPAQQIVKEEEAEKILSTFKFISPATSQNDTSTWKTYRNDSYGIDFKYPSGWYFEQAPQSICTTSGEVSLLCLRFDGEENRGKQNINSYGRLFLKIYGEESLASAFENQYERAEYFNGEKIKEIFINSLKIAVFRGGCYECYEATQNELDAAKARIISLACNSGGAVCARFIFSNGTNYEENKAFFLEQFLPTLNFSEKFQKIEYQKPASRG